MSDGTATRRRGLTKRPQADPRRGRLARRCRGGLRLRPPAVRELPRRTRRRAHARLAGLARARRSRRAQPRDVPAPVDGGAPGARLSRGDGDDAGVDRALDRLAGGCRSRDGGVVLDAQVVEVRSRRRRPRGGGRRHLEPARQPRLPGGRARAPDVAGRGSSGAAHGRSDRRGGARGRGDGLRAHPLAGGVGEPDRRPRRAACESRHARGAQRAGGVGRGLVRALPVAAPSDCCAAAGTSSRSRRSRAISRSSCCSSSACASQVSPSRRSP